MKATVATGRRKRIKGIGALAKKLGVTRDHLRFAIRGERKASKRILRALAKLKISIQPMSTHKRFSTELIESDPAPLYSDPAWANTNLEWLQSIAKLGYTAACVKVTFQPDFKSQGEADFDFEQVGREIAAADLGQFDSMQNDNGLNVFYYLSTKRLPDALKFLRARIEARQILPICKIAFADLETGVWRTFYPGA